ARHLDHLAGGEGVLARYVERVAAADFTQRRPLARIYAGIATGDHPLAGAELDSYLHALRRARANDIPPRPPYLTHRALANPDEYRALARRAGDPWFAATAAEVDGEIALNAGDLLAARGRLSAALEACLSARLEYRCAKLERALAEADAILHWPI